MVLTLDGNSEIGAHKSSNFCYLICLKHLIRSRAITYRFFLRKRPVLPSDMSTMLCQKVIQNTLRKYEGIQDFLKGKILKIRVKNYYGILLLVYIKNYI